MLLPAQEDVKHEDPPFTLKLPAGYAPIVPPPTTGELAWKRQNGDEMPWILTIQILPKRVPKSAGDPEALAPRVEKLLQGKPFTLRKFPWKGFDLLIMA